MIPERDYPQLASLNGCIEYLSARVWSKRLTSIEPAGRSALTWVNAGEAGGGPFSWVRDVSLGRRPACRRRQSAVGAEDADIRRS